MMLPRSWSMWSWRKTLNNGVRWGYFCHFSLDTLTRSFKMWCNQFKFLLIRFEVYERRVSSFRRSPRSLQWWNSPSLPLIFLLSWKKFKHNHQALLLITYSPSSQDLVRSGRRIRVLDSPKNDLSIDSRQHLVMSSGISQVVFYITKS